MSQLFTLPDIWTGGDFELALDFGGAGAQRLWDALDAAWSLPELRGPFTHRDVEPEEQVLGELSTAGVLYGVLSTPKGIVPCRSNVVTVDSEGEVAVEFSLGIPMGGLGLRYPVGAYPFSDGTELAWRDEITGLLFSVARGIYAHGRFRAGLIGWQADFEQNPRFDQPVPEVRWDALIRVEGSGPSLYPATEGFPMTKKKPWWKFR